MILVCKYCGSTQLLQDVAVDVNTNKIIYYYENFTCLSCDRESKYPYTKEEFEKKVKENK